MLVWLHYFPLWRQTDNPAGKRACFCTSPAVRHAPSNALSEIIGTFVLVFVAAAISSDNLSPNGLAPGFGPFLVGLLVLRTRGMFFIMVTLAFAQIFYFFFHDVEALGNREIGQEALDQLAMEHLLGAR